MLSSEQLAALFTPEAIAQRKITVEENRLRRARDLAERNALTEGVRNPGYDPDRGNVRFNYTQYGSGANALQYIDDARHTWKTYSELSPNQKGYENFRNYQRALLHNTGISDWSQATNRELFEAIDDTFRGYQEDNQKENFSFGIGDLAKIVAAATVTYMTAGAAAPYFGSTLGGTIATGALAGAAGATTSGILNNNLSLRGVATGAGIGGLLGGAQYAFRPDYFNPAALGLDPNAAASLYSPQALGGATAAGTSGLLRSGISALTPSFASQAGTSLGTSLLTGGINSIPVNYLGGSATNVFGALPTTGKDVVQGTTMNIAENSFGGNTAGLYPSGVEGSVYDSGGIFRGVGDVASKVLSPQNLLLSSAGSPAPEPAEGGFFNQLRGQLRSGPTITYADYDPVRSGVPGPAGFERTSNIGVPSGYGAIPTGGIADPSLPYGSGLDPYAPTDRPNFDLSPYFQSPKLFHRGGGVVNVDSGARPTDQESFYQTYESGSQQYSDNLGEGMGITYDRVEGTDIPPQSRLQVFETPPMGVGSLNDTARNMSRFAYGGGVGSLNETARAMTYAGGGIVRAAAMAWQPFKVKIKNQAIFGEFMGYTKTGKVRVLDQESGVEKIYPKSRVRRAYSDEPLPDEPVKKAIGGSIVKGAVKSLTQPKKVPKRQEYKDKFSEYDLYHGTRDDIYEFNLGHSNRKDAGWLGTGVYSTTDPRIASAYSTLKRGYGDPNVMPLKARLKNPYHATQAEKTRLMTISNNQGAEAGREAADAWTEALKQKGHDGVILSYGKEGHSEVVIFDPANIRSKFAQFDPAKKDSADILAAAGGPIIKGAAQVLTKPKKAPSLPAETLMATRPLSSTGSLFDEKKGRKLLIVGCCATKSKAEELIPASERYKGPLFTTLNTAGVPEDVDVAVLSAKHGLIRFDTPLEDYNVKMKDGRKDLLNSPEQLARINNTVDGYGEVFVAGGKDYRNFLDEAGIKGKYTTYTDHADKVRGIGDQRSILAKWLNEANRDRTGASAVPARTARASYATPLFDNSDPHVSDTRFNENLLVYLDEPNTPQMQERFGEEKVEQRNGFEVFQGEFGSWRYAVRGDDEKLVSVIQGVDLDDGSVVSNMYTRPDARNQGFAKLLFEKVASDKDNLAVSPHFSQSGAGFFGQRKKDGSSEGYATGGGVSSLNGIARNMTRYAYGGGVGSMNEIARSM